MSRQPHEHSAPGPGLSRLGHALVTTFGLGLRRPAPGTWGSLPPVLLAAILFFLGLGPDGTIVNWLVYNGVLLAIFIVFSTACVRYGDAAEARFGRKDPGQVCADETAGQCLALMFLPGYAVATDTSAAAMLLLAFFAFRIFDILKPWPAGRLQRIPGGWGVLIDDWAAGFYAAIVVQLVAHLT